MAQTTEQQITAMAHLAVQIADWSAAADIESNGVLDDSPGDGRRWYDVRPMVDAREHSPECIDLAQCAIDYVLLRHLAERHPQRPHLLRITRQP